MWCEVGETHLSRSVVGGRDGEMGTGGRISVHVLRRHTGRSLRRQTEASADQVTVRHKQREAQLRLVHTKALSMRIPVSVSFTLVKTRGQV